MNLAEAPRRQVRRREISDYEALCEIDSLYVHLKNNRVRHEDFVEHLDIPLEQVKRIFRNLVNDTL